MDNITSVLFAAINSRYIHSNLAFLYLDKLTGDLPCRIINKDWSINIPKKQVLREICRQNPQIIAFSVYIWNGEYIKSLCSDLRQLLPGSLIVMGGPEASARPHDFLADGLSHAVIVGEGENTWPQFLKAYLDGQQKPFLPGLLWAGQEDFLSADYCNMDDLPFPYSPQDLAAFSDKIVYYESSRGCPYSCSFCASGQDKLRFRSLDKVREDLRFLAAYRRGQVKFVDRTFNADKKRALEICKFLLDLYHPELNWHFELSPFLLDDDLIELLNQAPVGYFQLEIGVQSLCPKVLQAVRRYGSWEKAERNIKKILAIDNCHVHLDLIAGLPLETLDGVKEAFARLHKLYPHHLQLGFLKVLPGSLLAQEAAEYSIAFSKYAPYQVLFTKSMSGEDLFYLEEAAWAVDAFYNCGRFRQTLFYAANNWPEGALAFYAALAELKEKRFDGSLNMQKRAELLGELLLQGEEKDLYFDLLRLDWLLYGKGQPLPYFLRSKNDKKENAEFFYQFSFRPDGLVEYKKNPSSMSFDYSHLLGVSCRAGIKISLATKVNL
ncbi:MAG: DUF4080 domain-containing protein [Bacillota bacterium]|jgi:radical SAM superfamily enzyme YgiQ (UPF0313 family)